MTFPVVLRSEQRSEYWQKIVNLFSSSIIGYWPMSEQGGAVAYDYGKLGHNGAYTGVTLGQPGIGDGRTCPLFDGASDFNNLYSAGLAGAFNVAQGTIMAWMRIGAAEWIDATNRYALRFGTDDNNHVILNKSTTNNNIRVQYRANSISDEVIFSTGGRLDFFNVGMTWSTVADQVICYYQGVQQGATQTALGAWAGVLDSTRCLSGAFTTAGGNGFIGNIAGLLLLNRTATADEMLAASRV